MRVAWNSQRSQEWGSLVVPSGPNTAIDWQVTDGVGRLTIDRPQVLNALDGAKPGEMAVESQKETKLIINAKAAKAMGVEIPQSLRDKADQVIE